MSSEAEFERLYQEFVRKGGGSLTGTNTPNYWSQSDPDGQSGTNTNANTSTLNSAILNSLGETVNTPASYYSETSKVNLSPSKLAELQAAEEQYNKQQALAIIVSELDANNFTNPYNTVANTGVTNYTAYGSSPGVASLQGVNTSFNLLESPGLGGDTLAKATIIAGVLAATGVDFEKILLGAILGTAAVSMFTDLKSHTDLQNANLPQTLQDADMLSGLNKSFGAPDSNSCSMFNDLMGIMSGAFDGAFDLLGGATASLLSILESTGIPALFNTIASSVSGLIDGIVGSIKDNVNSLISGISGIVNSVIASTLAAFPILGDIGSMLGDLAGMASSAFGAVSSVANQILGEIAGIANMAAQIASKLSAMAMSAAMLDPCKLAVLMNTGSDQLKNAAGLLNAPLPSGIPKFGIPTTTDLRANAEDVTSTMATVKADALTQPGVPQSPFSSAAGAYQPIDAYLFDRYNDFSTSLTAQHETVITSDGSAKIIKKSVTGSNSVSATSKSITPSSQQLQGQPSPAELDTPPKIGDVDGINSGGADKSAAAPGKTRADAKNPQTDQSASAADSTSSGSHNQFSSGTDADGFGYKEEKLNPQRLQKVNSAAFKVWKREVHDSGISTATKKAKAAFRDIASYLRSSNTIWQSTDQKNTAKILAEELKLIASGLRNPLMAEARNKLDYQSPGGDVDSVQEAEKRKLYKSSIKTPHLRRVTIANGNISNAITSWESIKSQTVKGS